MFMTCENKKKTEASECEWNYTVPFEMTAAKF